MKIFIWKNRKWWLFIFFYFTFFIILKGQNDYNHFNQGLMLSSLDFINSKLESDDSLICEESQSELELIERYTVQEVNKLYRNRGGWLIDSSFLDSVFYDFDLDDIRCIYLSWGLDFKITLVLNNSSDYKAFTYRKKTPSSIKIWGAKELDFGLAEKELPSIDFCDCRESKLTFLDFYILIRYKGGDFEAMVIPEVCLDNDPYGVLFGY